jgi:hypothetical protein
MSRFFLMICLFFIALPAGAEDYVSYFGKKYQTRSPSHPCQTQSFRDNGVSVDLCIDSLGRPIPADALAAIPPAGPQRKPASR